MTAAGTSLAWKERTGKPATATVADLADDTDLRAEVQSAVDLANKTVSHSEAIKKFRILPTDFTEETGEMTPTMKVKRNVVHQKYAEQIEAAKAQDLLLSLHLKATMMKVSDPVLFGHAVRV